MPYAVPNSTGGTATSPIAPLTAASTRLATPQADELTLCGGDNHGERVGYPQQLRHRLSLRACITVRSSLVR